MIEELSVVSSVCFHDGDKTHKAGVYANLRCSASSSYGGCGELGQRIERDHGPTCVVTEQKLQTAEKDANDTSTKRPADEGATSLNANEVLILHRRLKIIQERAEQANKVALETEKVRDEFHNQIEQIEQQLQHHRETTRVQTGSCFTTVLVLLGGLHTGVMGPLLWQWT